MITEENSVWIALVLVVGVGLICLIGSSHYEYISAFEHGYCETLSPGMQSTHWTKCQ